MLLYLIDYIICLRLFNTSGGDVAGTIASRFRWLAFGEYCSGALGIWGHYIVLSIMTVLFIGLEVHRNKYKWIDIKKGRTIWIEDIIIMSILAFLPSLIMVITGGSAAYFSYAVETPALVLLCGHNYINIEKEAKGALKFLIYIITFSWCIWAGYHHKPKDPLTLITNEHKSNLSSMLLEIRATVGENPQNYTSYLEENSLITQVFPDSKTAIFVCPAMTGVGVINATYMQDGTYYSYTGEHVVNYGTDGVSNECLSYEDALSVAKNRGKQKMIHFTDTGYEIVDL